MPLTKCKKCGKDISDKASACPFCGNPMTPVLIEQTSKQWKKVKLISWIVFLGGFFMFMSNFNTDGFNSSFTWLGIVLAFFGFIGIFVGKFGAWWHHK